MYICEACGREFESERTECTDCRTQLTPLRELDSFGTYTRLRDQSRDGDSERVQDSSGSRLLFPVAAVVGAIVPSTGYDRLSYVVSLLVVGWGFIGIHAGYWLGGLIVIISSVLLTPPSRRATGSFTGILLFVVVFLLGRSSPTTWLF